MRLVDLISVGSGLDGVAKLCSSVDAANTADLTRMLGQDEARLSNS